ncbi:hypothetical protein Nmel_009762, partial [Mimus melanotis]
MERMSIMNHCQLLNLPLKMTVFSALHLLLQETCLLLK